MKNRHKYWFISLIAISFLISANAQIANQTVNKNQYRISEIYDIRQNVNPNGFTYFASPFRKNYIFGLRETKDFVIAWMDNQLDVFDKKNKYWQIFTLSDGFRPMRYPIQFYVDYEDYFVVKGPDYSDHFGRQSVVNIFDKNNFKVFSVSTEEYENLKKDWKVDNFVPDENDKWYSDGTYPITIIHDDKNALQKSRYTNTASGQNHIKEIKSNDDYCVVTQQFGIRTIDKRGNVRLLNTTHGLYSENVGSIDLSNDKLLVLYDSVIDIFQLDNFSLIKRFPINEKISHVAFNGEIFFYSTGNKLIIQEIDGNTTIDSISLNANISGIDFFYPMVILYSDLGFSSYNIQTKETQHFLLNGFKKDTGQSDDNIDFDFSDTFCKIGKIGDVVIGIKQKAYYESIPKNEIILYNLPLNQIIKNQDSLFPNQVLDLINTYHPLNPNIFISEDHMLYGNQGRYTIFKIETGKTPFAFNELLKFEMGKKTKKQFAPNIFERTTDYPTARKVNAFTYFNEQPWIGTDDGLFTIDSLNNWISLYVPSTLIGYSKELMVSDEGIYNCFSGKQISRSWSRIDRSTFGISHFKGRYSWSIWEKGFKLKGNEMIAATKEGFLFYDFSTQKSELINTPEPIGQVAFFKDGYIAASENNLFEYDKDRILTNFYLLIFEKSKFEKHTLPYTMDVDGDNIWLSSGGAELKGILTLFNMKTQLRLDYLVPGKKHIRKVIADKDHVWIFGTDFIYRYDRKTSTLNCLGRIKRGERDLAKIRDAIENGSVVYISTDLGIFELNKETLSFRQSEIPVFTNHYPGEIVKQGTLYFISLAGGVVQINENEFEKGFYENENINLFQYDYDDCGIIYPE